MMDFLASHVWLPDSTRNLELGINCISRFSLLDPGTLGPGIRHGLLYSYHVPMIVQFFPVKLAIMVFGCIWWYSRFADKAADVALTRLSPLQGAISDVSRWCAICRAMHSQDAFIHLKKHADIPWWSKMATGRSQSADHPRKLFFPCFSIATTGMIVWF